MCCSAKNITEESKTDFSCPLPPPIHNIHTIVMETQRSITNTRYTQKYKVEEKGTDKH